MEKDDFLDNIKELPKWVELYGINHHSPSQINSNDDIWSYKYLYLSQEERRELPINSKMFSGVCLGDMAQLQFGNYVCIKIIIKKNAAGAAFFFSIWQDC